MPERLLSSESVGWRSRRSMPQEAKLVCPFFLFLSFFPSALLYSPSSSLPRSWAVFGADI